jgi:hypothetical protein
MLQESLLASAGDYAASLGTTAVDIPVIVSDNVRVVPNGPFEAVNGVRLVQITDGLSNTLLIGEKHVPPFAFGAPPLDCGMYDGHNPQCNTRAAGPLYPLAASQKDDGWKFGSAHPGICQFVFCDGSVHSLSNTIDPVLLGLLAQRDDGQPVPGY